MTDPGPSSLLRIRPAERSDVAVIAALERAVFEDGAYPRVFLQQATELWPDLICVAEEGATVCGYALAAPSQRHGEAWILAVAVIPGGRRRGVGGALTSDLLRRLRVAGFSRVALTVHPRNSPALHLYRRLGFEVEEELDDYFGPAEPRLRLALQLREPGEEP